MRIFPVFYFYHSNLSPHFKTSLNKIWMPKIKAIAFGRLISYQSRKRNFSFYYTFLDSKYTLQCQPSPIQLTYKNPIVFNIILEIPQHPILLLGAIKVTVVIKVIHLSEVVFHRRILWDWHQCVSVQVRSQLHSALPSHFTIKAFEWQVVNISSTTLVNSAINTNQTNSVLNFIYPC